MVDQQHTINLARDVSLLLGSMECRSKEVKTLPRDVTTLLCHSVLENDNLHKIKYAIIISVANEKKLEKRMWKYCGIDLESLWNNYSILFRKNVKFRI